MSTSPSRSRSRSRERIIPQQEVFRQIQAQNREKAEEIKRAFGYTNEDNPYGDTNLEKPFIWKQKLEAQPDYLTTISKEQNHQETVALIEKVKQRRMEREMEKQKQEDERGDYLKEREDTNYTAWLKKEQGFHHEQDKHRSQMRINQRRFMLVDYFNLCVTHFRHLAGQSGITHDDWQDVLALMPTKQLREYMTGFQGKISQEKAIEENLQEALILQSLESQQDYRAYWDSVVVLLTREQTKQENQQEEAEYQQEIEAILKDKSREQLDQMHGQIERTLLEEQGQFEVDKTYWQNMLQQVQLYRASRVMLDYYAQYQQNAKSKRTIKERIAPPNISITKEGSLSPTLLPFSESLLNKAISQADQTENIKQQRESIFKDNLQGVLDRVRSQQKRIQLIKAQNKKEDMEDYIDRNRKDFQDNEISQEITDFLTMENIFKNEDEEQFQDEIDLQESYNWVLQYKARKPKYLNKVKTGFDWSKYNQTHYDEDNPPPKVIIGYKFNIFYPDLISKRDIPQYVLEPCENKDYCLIRFKAGPPYEVLPPLMLGHRLQNIKQRMEFNRQVWIQVPI